jgi:hypothetical protein
MSLSVELLRRVPRVAERCPHCLEHVVTTYVWRCGRCSAAHHADCARAHGSCAVVGCFASTREPLGSGASLGPLVWVLAALLALASLGYLR